MVENRKVKIILILFVCLYFANCISFRSGNCQRSSPIQTMTTIRTLQLQYASKHQGKFAPNFDELIKTVFLDENFRGEKPIINKYVYEMKVIEPTENQRAFYSIKANPQTSERTWFERIWSKNPRSYYFDSTLKAIKYSEECEANAQSPSI